MQTTMFYVFGSAAALMVPTTIVYLIMLAILFSRLRAAHPAAYKDLGEPSFFANNSISNGIRVVGFLINRDYRDLHDPAVDRVAGVCRLLFVGAVILFGIAVLAVIASWFGYSH